MEVVGDKLKLAGINNAGTQITAWEILSGQTGRTAGVGTKTGLTGLTFSNGAWTGVNAAFEADTTIISTGATSGAFALRTEIPAGTGNSTTLEGPMSGAGSPRCVAFVPGAGYILFFAFNSSPNNSREDYATLYAPYFTAPSRPTITGAVPARLPYIRGA
jgi:hypothetical protein